MLVCILVKDYGMNEYMERLVFIYRWGGDGET